MPAPNRIEYRQPDSLRWEYSGHNDNRGIWTLGGAQTAIGNDESGYYCLYTGDERWHIPTTRYPDCPADCIPWPGPWTRPQQWVVYTSTASLFWDPFNHTAFYGFTARSKEDAIAKIEAEYSSESWANDYPTFIGPPGAQPGQLVFVPTAAWPACPSGLLYVTAPQSVQNGQFFIDPTQSTPEPQESMPPSPSVTPVTLSPLKPNAMVQVAIKRLPDDYRLYLFVNAQPLHELLDRIGVQKNGVVYKNRPATTFSVASENFQLSTDTLLRCEYPARFSISDFTSRPPSYKQLKTLCESAGAAVRRILEHYQPIDIQVTVAKSAVRP